MFEHSVRVPRHYKVAATIFKKVATEGGSVKTLLYDNKLRHFRTNVLFALITETVKHAVDIDKIFESSEILKKESRLDPWLAKVLTAELLFGKKSLPGISKPEQTLLAYKEQFEKYMNEHEDELKTEVVHRPRYVRINTNLLATSDAIRSFQDEGYRFIRCTSGSYNDYIQQIQGLKDYDFTQDYHVKTIFVFPHGTKLHEHELYLESQIILQDKATAMAVHLLAPPVGSVVLDMCAAPGMKTTQAAAYMRNEGKVYAVERNERRFQTLTDFVNKTGCKCVEPIHKDVFDIRRGDYDDVEYILLDPSCSGSGMEFSVHNYVEDTRLAKLTSLQEKILKHAVNAFPKAKRIVYSTCSLFPEENERVITNVVKNSRVKWRVQDVKEMLKGQWNNFGSGMYGSMGTRCLYARPDSDLTTGFFLAVLDRDIADLEKARNGEEGIVNEEKRFDKNITVKGKRKRRERLDNDVIETEDDIENINKKNKKDQEADTSTVTNEDLKCDNLREKMDSSIINGANITNSHLLTNLSNKKTKKRKQDSEQVSNCNSDLEINDSLVIPEVEYPAVKKKKNKHKIKDYKQPNNAESNEEVPKKKDRDKSKKQHKSGDCVDNSEASNETYENLKAVKTDSYSSDTQINYEDKATLGDEFLIVKKKKKKHKIKCNTEDKPNTVEVSEEPEFHKDQVTPKKKKHKYSDHADSNIDNLGAANENNEINCQQIDDGAAHNQNDVEFRTKNKKKKRDKSKQ